MNGTNNNKVTPSYNPDSMFSSLEETCYECGKKFYRGVDHIYKTTVPSKPGDTKNRKVVYFCRYNHYVKYMKDHGKW